MRTTFVALAFASTLLLAGCVDLGAADPSATPTSSESVAPTSSAEPTTDPTATAEPSTEPSATSDPSDGAVPDDVEPRVDVAQVSGDWLVLGVTVVGASDQKGVCEISLTRGGETTTAAVAARYNVDTTVCGGRVLDISDLDSGDYDLQVSYSSSRHTGTSATTTVTIP